MDQGKSEEINYEASTQVVYQRKYSLPTLEKVIEEFQQELFQSIKIIILDFTLLNTKELFQGQYSGATDFLINFLF